jgi:hypothetical protein
VERAMKIQEVLLRAASGALTWGRRGSPGLLLKPLDAHRVAGQIGREKFQGDLSPEAQLRREPHFPHAARAEGANDLVGPDCRSGHHAHVATGRGVA